MTVQDAVAEWEDPAPHAPIVGGCAPALPAVVDGELADDLRELCAVREALQEAEARWGPRLEAVPAGRRASARNLVHYLALRRLDLRPLQRRLAARGLSSLGRAEGHVLASVDAALGALHRLAGLPWAPPAAAGPDHAAGEALLRRHAEALLGPSPEGRAARVMVTAPPAAASDYGLVRDLLAAGMDCLRIDCARGDPPAWAATVAHLRRAEAEVGRPCRVLLELAGPQLRTGPLQPGPAVVKWRPRRDIEGVLVAPARVWLTGAAAPAPAPGPADATLPVPDAWLATLERDDRLRFIDARGAHRTLEVTAVAGGGCWASCQQTAYVEPGIRLEVRGHRGGRGCRGGGERAPIGPLPPLERPIVLRPGDTLLLTRDLTPGHPAVPDAAGRVASPARIGCTLPEVFAAVRPGERIWFDGGKIGGRVRDVDAGAGVLAVEVTHARPGGSRLRAGRTIHLPDSVLRVAPLTAKDEQDLAFAAAHADLIGLASVRTPETVHEILARLERLGGPARRLGLVLSIGTRSGFAQLPEILLAAMGAPAYGVMLARGDLSIEVGYERLAEVQEEILWLGGAGHAPVIWGTRVLEQMARTGEPTEAEVTDAAVAARAEGVLLAEGPHVAEAARALDDILRRLHGHRHKKMSLLRRMRSWSIDGGDAGQAPGCDPETGQARA
jgi:pyruvate kinase